MATKCIKLEIKYITKENKLPKDEFLKWLKYIQYKSYLACNRAMTYYYTNDMQGIIQKEVGLEIQKDKDVYGKSIGSWVENRMNEIIEVFNSINIAQTRQFVESRYKNDKKSGLLKGDISLSEFKKDMPIYFHNKSYEIISTPKGLGIEISFFNLAKLKELGMKKGERIKFLFPGIDKSRKSILTNIMLKTYKQGSLQLTYNKRKKKWMAIISFTFEPKTKELDKNKILGIDLGITKVATMSVYDANKEDWELMNFKDKTIDGKELIHYRQKIETRKRDLSIASKWASDNRTGHGYKNRMLAANKVGDKYNRFKDTYNHKVSRYIVDLAVKYNCGIIQMEDLSGFSEYQTESLLKNWSYYDLQNKIKYKAEEKGIEVRFINPKYTSKRCSKCGCIHVDNRDCKNDQANFTCKVCGYHDNADINASKNISIPYIDEIIKETEVQAG